MGTIVKNNIRKFIAATVIGVTILSSGSFAFAATPAAPTSTFVSLSNTPLPREPLSDGVTFACDLMTGKHVNSRVKPAIETLLANEVQGYLDNERIAAGLLTSFRSERARNEVDAWNTYTSVEQGLTFTNALHISNAFSNEVSNTCSMDVLDFVPAGAPISGAVANLMGSAGHKAEILSGKVGAPSFSGVSVICLPNGDAVVDATIGFAVAGGSRNSTGFVLPTNGVTPYGLGHSCPLPAPIGTTTTTTAPTTSTTIPNVVVPPTTTGALFTSVAPIRILDTRNGAQLNAGGAVSAVVPGVLDIGYGADLNVTAVAGSAGGFLTVWPCGNNRPNTSSLNFDANEVVANHVLAAFTASNNTVGVSSSVNVNVIIDFQGIWQPSGGFEGRQPVRVLDTRNGDAKKLSGLDPNKAVLLNLTVASNSVGFASVFPCAIGDGGSSNVNFNRNARAAFAVVVPDSTGSICVNTSTFADAIIDVIGYAPAAKIVSSANRVFDSRNGTKLSGPLYSLNLDKTTLVNFTAVDADAAGFLSVARCGTVTNASLLNFTTGSATPNSIVLGSGCWTVTSSNVKVHLIADKLGTFS
jgi:hypothetical protein